MNEKTITVIIPVYNMEKYLRKSIDAVLSQTYKNFELLIVNDGSTDGSYEICEEYANKDKRVKVIHKQNGGVSSARNVGIENAEGKYITFCDADDELMPFALQSMLNAAERTSADLVVGGIQNVSINFNKTLEVIRNPINRDFIVLNGRDSDSFGKIWEDNDMLKSDAKLYVHDVILKNNLRYNEKLVVLEDFDFVAEYLLHCEKIVSIEDVIYKFYHYEEAGANYLRRGRRDFADDVASAYNKQKQLFQFFGLDIFENRWLRWRCMFGNFGGALDSIWHQEVSGVKEKIAKSKRLRDILKMPEFKDYIEFNKGNLTKSEYFYMKHPSVLSMFLLRRVRAKLGK